MGGCRGCEMDNSPLILDAQVNIPPSNPEFLVQREGKETWQSVDVLPGIYW
jgi:hypothetical protein